MEQTTTTGGSDDKFNLCAKSNANRSVIQVLEGYHYDVTDAEKQRQQDLQVVNSFANTYAAIY